MFWEVVFLFGCFLIAGYWWLFVSGDREKLERKETRARRPRELENSSGFLHFEAIGETDYYAISVGWLNWCLYTEEYGPDSKEEREIPMKNIRSIERWSNWGGPRNDTFSGTVRLAVADMEKPYRTINFPNPLAAEEFSERVKMAIENSQIVQS